MHEWLAFAPLPHMYACTYMHRYTGLTQFLSMTETEAAISIYFPWKSVINEHIKFQPLPGLVTIGVFISLFVYGDGAISVCNAARQALHNQGFTEGSSFKIQIHNPERWVGKVQARHSRRIAGIHNVEGWTQNNS